MTEQPEPLPYDPEVVRCRMTHHLRELQAGRRSFEHTLDDLVEHVEFAYRNPVRIDNERVVELRGELARWQARHAKFCELVEAFADELPDEFLERAQDVWLRTLPEAQPLAHQAAQFAEGATAWTDHLFWEIAAREGLCDAVGSVEWLGLHEGTARATPEWIDQHDALLDTIREYGVETWDPALEALVIRAVPDAYRPSHRTKEGASP